MPNNIIADADDALLRVTAAVCDNGYAWVAAGLSSRLADYTPADLEGLAAAMKERDQSSEIIRRMSDELRNNLGRLVPSSVHVHEETHFYQLISTSYGRLASEIERYWVSDLLAIIRELSSTGSIDPGSLSVRAWVEQSLAHDSSTRDIAEYAEFVYTQIHAIKACFSGSPFIGFMGHKVTNLTIGDALNAWPGFLCAQDRAEGAQDAPDLRIQQVTHPSTLTTRLAEDSGAVPVVDGTPLTPRAIFEGAALQIQLDWARVQLGDSRDLPSTLRLVNPGFLDQTYLITRRIVGRRFPQVAWPIRRTLLLTLSDLALWGPTHRDYLGGGDFELPWEDLHPGYRFVRALDVVAERRRYLSDSDLETPSAITELICDELQWLTPVQMAQNYLRADAIDRAASQVARDALRGHRIRAAMARVAEPAVFVDATNEQEIHEQFHLVLPFIVERGALRMPDVPELYELLLLSTVAHVASGLFDGRMSRLFNEPLNASDIVHKSALELIVEDKATEFVQQLMPTDSHIASRMASELVADASGLDELIQRLNQEGLDEYSRAIRNVRLYGEDAALDWFCRQPAIAEAVRDLREVRSDGSFTIEWPILYGLLRQAITQSNPDSLKELFEDCGHHYFNRDIEDLRRWLSHRTDVP